MGDITVRANYAVLDRLYAETPQRADKIAERICKDMKADIDDHWSATSPSSPGAAPAVVSEALKDSGEPQRLSRGLWRLIYRAEHAAMLEYGTRKMAARPFLQPAAERMRPRLEDYYKDLFSL